MTWSISANGPKADVQKTIEEATFNGEPNGPEGKSFECAKKLCKAQVECLPTESASVSASGHSGGCSVSISGS